MRPCYSSKSSACGRLVDTAQFELGDPRRATHWLGVSSLFTLGLYSLWPESWRFSRMTVLGLLVVHGLVHAAITYRAWRRQGNPFRIRRLLVASKDMESMADLLRRNEGERTRLQSFALWAGESLPQDAPDLQGVPWLGVNTDLEEVIRIHDLDEVVFSGRDVPTDIIVAALPILGRSHVKCRIAWTDVGDVMSSGGASREVFVAFQRGLHLPEVARSKRAFDVVSSVLLLLCSPWLLLSQRKPWVAASWGVLVGRSTWVSPGQLHSLVPYHFSATQGLSGRPAERKAFTHAQDYHWRKDLSVVADALISRRAIISHGHH